MVKNIAGLIPTIMAVELVDENLHELNKKKKSTKDLTKMGVKNIMGLSLIGATSGIVKGL